MRPGILVRHHKLPDRSTGLVRSDITGFLAFIPEDRWPENASAGDYFEVKLRRSGDLFHHPNRHLLHPVVMQAVRAFFANGGDTAFVYGVAIRSEADLQARSSALGVLAPLLDHLRCEDDLAILAVPEAAYMRCEMSRDGKVHFDADTLFDELLAHCREMNNRFLIMDTPRGLHGDLLLRWVDRMRDRHPEVRSHGAIYYPWLMAGDELFPPSGAVAGVFARTELSHGPFGVVWPPANTTIDGVTHTEVELSWDEAGDLTSHAINPIVIQAGRGVIIFGARTMSKEQAFLHINSRRIVNMVAEQLRRDNEWAVFETNNPHLWAVLERDVRFRLSQFWSAGLLAGDKDSSEYSVKCDKEINPIAVRDAGQVNVQVMLKPMGTTEQIQIDLRLGGETRIGGG